ncbi:transcription initiation factor TFIID subunit 4-like [Schistocerca serialis cubense]|uniref:transcription initiation factor TFIID subunit 4-like n=1 Tax=Schistocerca serialis cubense TaxID=2023355 RepID=UPI00214F2589|nr:transcription initiation factor TFIID subunit 4-like [Schistocerca serialis cubense]
MIITTKSRSFRGRLASSWAHFLADGSQPAGRGVAGRAGPAVIAGTQEDGCADSKQLSQRATAARLPEPAPAPAPPRAAAQLLRAVIPPNWPPRPARGPAPARPAPPLHYTGGSGSLAAGALRAIYSESAAHIPDKGNMRAVVCTSNKTSVDRQPTDRGGHAGPRLSAEASRHTSRSLLPVGARLADKLPPPPPPPLSSTPLRNTARTLPPPPSSG